MLSRAQEIKRKLSPEPSKGKKTFCSSNPG